MEQNHMEILLEEMRSKFDLVLEGHTVLNARIEALDRKIDEKHDLTAFKIDALKERIDTVEQSLTARIDMVEHTLTTRIDTVESNLTAHIAAVAADLSAHRADTEAHPRYLVRE